MFKALLRSIITIVCLVVLIALVAVNTWQNDRIERQNITLLEKEDTVGIECVDGSGEDSTLGAWQKCYESLS